jgi:hypothetical protein
MNDVNKFKKILYLKKIFITKNHVFLFLKNFDLQIFFKLVHNIHFSTWKRFMK